MSESEEEYKGLYFPPILIDVAAYHKIRGIALSKLVSREPVPEKLMNISVTPVTGEPKKKKGKSTLTWKDQLSGVLKLSLLIKNLSWIENYRPKKRSFEKWSHLLHWVLIDGPASLLAGFDQKISQMQKAIEHSATLLQTIVGEIKENRTMRYKIIQWELHTELMYYLKEKQRVTNLITALNLLVNDEDVTHDSEEEQSNLTERQAELEELDGKIQVLTSAGASDKGVDPGLSDEISYEERKEQLDDRYRDMDARLLEAYMTSVNLVSESMAEIVRLEKARAKYLPIESDGMPSVGLAVASERTRIAYNHFREALESVRLQVPNPLRNSTELVIQEKNEALNSSERSYNELKTNALIPRENIVNVGIDRLRPSSPTINFPIDLQVPGALQSFVFLLASLVRTLDTPVDQVSFESLKDIVEGHIIEHFTAFVLSQIQPELNTFNERLKSDLRERVKIQEKCANVSARIEEKRKEIQILEAAAGSATQVQLTNLQIALQALNEELQRLEQFCEHKISPEFQEVLINNRDSDFVDGLRNVDESTYAAILDAVLKSTLNAYSSTSSSTSSDIVGDTVTVVATTTGVKPVEMGQMSKKFSNAFEEFRVIYKRFLIAFSDFNEEHPFNDSLEQFQKLSSLFDSFQNSSMMSSIPGYVWPLLTGEDLTVVKQIDDVREVFSDKTVAAVAKSEWAETRVQRLNSLMINTGAFIPELLLNSTTPMKTIHLLFDIDGAERLEGSFFSRDYENAARKVVTTTTDAYDKIEQTKYIASLIMGEIVASGLRVYLEALSI